MCLIVAGLVQADLEMAQAAAALFGWRTPFGNNTPNLVVIGHAGIHWPYTLGTTDTALERIEDVLDSII